LVQEKRRRPPNDPSPIGDGPEFAAKPVKAWSCKGHALLRTAQMGTNARHADFADIPTRADKEHIYGQGHTSLAAGHPTADHHHPLLALALIMMAGAFVAAAIGGSLRDRHP
jgi:hypothetical protein